MKPIEVPKIMQFFGMKQDIRRFKVALASTVHVECSVEFGYTHAETNIRGLMVEAALTMTQRESMVQMWQRFREIISYREVAVPTKPRKKRKEE